MRKREGGEHAEHEGEEEVHGDPAGPLLGPAPALETGLVGDPVEAVAQRHAVALRRQERVDQRTGGVAPSGLGRLLEQRPPSPDRARSRRSPPSAPRRPGPGAQRAARPTASGTVSPPATARARRSRPRARRRHHRRTGAGPRSRRATQRGRHGAPAASSPSPTTRRARRRSATAGDADRRASRRVTPGRRARRRRPAGDRVGAGQTRTSPTATSAASSGITPPLRAIRVIHHAAEAVQGQPDGQAGQARRRAEQEGGRALVAQHGRAARRRPGPRSR